MQQVVCVKRCYSGSGIKGHTLYSNINLWMAIKDFHLSILRKNIFKVFSDSNLCKSVCLTSDPECQEEAPSGLEAQRTHFQVFTQKMKPLNPCNFLGIPYPTVQKQCLFPPTTGQMCKDEKVWKVWTSFQEQLFSFLTSNLDALCAWMRPMMPLRGNNPERKSVNLYHHLILSSATLSFCLWQQSVHSTSKPIFMFIIQWKTGPHSQGFICQT